MLHDDEVVPDSQDEAELHVSDATERNISPPFELPRLTHATIPSSSSSFVLPAPMPPRPRPLPASTISQFTTTTDVSAAAPSAISAFPSSSAASTNISAPTTTTAKPRPRPRPAYATSPPRAPHATSPPHAPHATPPPPTFSADISERIKARRAPAVVRALQERKAAAPPLPTHVSPSVREGVSPLKRGPYVDLVKPPPAKKQRKESVPRKSEDGKKAQEKEGQFKSREFIEDSDDELAMGAAAPAAGLKPVAAEKGVGQAVTVVIPAKPLPKKATDKKRKKGADGDGAVDAEGVDPPKKKKKRVEKKPTQTQATEPKRPTEAASAPRKSLPAPVREIPDNDEIVLLPKKKKGGRKIVEDDEDEDAPGKVNAAPTAKEPILKTPASAPAKKHTPQAAAKLPPPSETTPLPKKKKGGRKIVEDDEDEDSAKENAAPTPKETTPKTPTSAPAKKPTPPAVAKPPPPSAKQPPPAPAKQPPHAPASKPPTTTPKPSPAAKPSPLHPPKNRPLSSILHRLNGASPRPRASPSVSRTLLTRIAPLHPNRRTPPPPPPPRVAPKKTKKELEREERWEEELQEGVEGWCELEEGERERMRRAKRDWEMGVCEE